VQMTAAVLAGVGEKLRLEQVDLAPPRDGEVLVKIAASGLCASDLNAVDGKRTLAPFPLVLGHEAAGVVTQTGPRVTRLQAGDAVVLSIVPSCGGCPACVRGRPNYCQTAARAMNRGSLLDGSIRLSRNGMPLHHFLTVSAFAQYAVVPESGAVAIDARMPLDLAALISCAVLTGVGAVRNTARVRPGSRVAVFGCGGVGLSAIQGARLAGADRIVAVDVTEEKLELARTVGATDVLLAGLKDAASSIRRLVGGVDYAFEAAGREQTIQQAWSSLDVGGTAVVIGLMPQRAMVALDAAGFINEQGIRGCYFGSAHLQRDVPALVDDYLAGNLLLDELITRRIGLADLNEALDALRAGQGARSVVVFD
jgi:S-(hydroxymethyl)glutathione dehydrogenase / alcohol dehydrogenase